MTTAAIGEQTPNIPSFIQPTTDTNIERMTPTVSVDRAIGHLASNLDVNINEIREFYYTLPHDDKPDLDKLHIHFTATRDKHRLGPIGGFFNSYGPRAALESYATLPELGEITQPTIVVNVGNVLLREGGSSGLGFINDLTRKERKEGKPNSPTLINQVLNQTVTHELTHFAQLSSAEAEEKRAEPTTAETAKHIAYTACDRALSKWRQVLSGSVVGLYVSQMDILNSAYAMSTAGKLAATAVALSTSMLAHTVTDLPISIREAAKFKREYRETDTEIDARNHEDPNKQLATVSARDELKLPLTFGPRSFKQNSSALFARFLTYRRHKTLSQKPPIKNK